jgi:hypothetical protein
MAVNVVNSALSSRNLNKWLPWIAGGVLAVGVIVFLVVYFGNTADKSAVNSPLESGKAQTPQVVKQVPLESGARVAAARFVETAVARKNLAEAWKLAGPDMRGGLTFKQWMTGDIPVVPLGAPIDKAAITKILYSHPKEASFNLVLLPKTPNKNGVGATLYVVTVNKVGQGAAAHWIVTYCYPQASPGAPAPS